MASEKSSPNGGGAAPSSIQFSVSSDRSRPMHLLQMTIKPMRPRLVAPPKKAWPAGSVRLDPPSSAGKRCKVEERKRKEIWTYELVPKSSTAPDGPARHSVYYFAGGSFQNVPSGEHWRTLAAISSKVSETEGGKNTRVFMVSPPLAPSSPAKDSLRLLRAWLEDVLEEAHSNGHTVTLAGDSSGGNLAATLAIGACGGWPPVTEWKADKEDIAAGNTGSVRQDETATMDVDVDMLCLPRSPFASSLNHVLLICPSLDKRNKNPEIAKVGKLDPLLTPEFTGHVADCWRGTSEVTSHPSNQDKKQKESAPEDDAHISDRAMRASDPRISPLLADLNVLKDLNVTVDGLIAGLDSLSPNGRAFVEKLREAGVSGEWQLWELMMHCWTLTWFTGMREGNRSLEWVINRIVRAANAKQQHGMTEG